MRAGVVQLHRWGLLDEVVAAGTPAVRTTTFRFADEEVRITIKPSHGVDALYAPRRTVLDPILVDAARAAGAGVEYGTTITDVIRDGTGRTVGVAGRDSRGRAVRRMARWIVGADGLRSVVADAVGSTIERRGTGATAVMYGYWSGLATDDYLWIFRPGACAGLIPTNGGHTCVFAASTPARVGKGGIDTLHDVVGAADPALGARLASTPPMSGVRTFGGVVGYMRAPWGPGWALVGDAAYWKDPLGAHGLSRRAPRRRDPVASHHRHHRRRRPRVRCPRPLPPDPRSPVASVVRRRRHDRGDALDRRRDPRAAPAAQLDHER